VFAIIPPQDYAQLGCFITDPDYGPLMLAESVMTTGPAAELSGLDKALPLAADHSGICVGGDMLLPTWKDANRTTQTAAATDGVATLDKVAVSNPSACPATN